MGDSNYIIADATWECYYTASRILKHLKVTDIIKNYVIEENKVKLEDCIKSYINAEERYIIASCNVKGKSSLKGIYSKECWVSFFAENQANNCYTLYIVDPTNNTNGAITKEQVRQIFLDRFLPKRVDFKWYHDQTSTLSLSSGLGYLKSSIDSSREDAFVLAPLGSALDYCLSFDKHVVKCGLSEMFSAKPTLVKILCALHRILMYVKTYCPSEEELKNLTEILHKKNFRPKGQSENDLQEEIIKVLCKIENHVKIAQKCSADIFNYCCQKKAVHRNILHRYEMQLMHEGSTSEVKECLSLAITDRLKFIIAVLHLIPTKEIVYEMLNDVVEYLVSSEAESLAAKEKELLEKVNAVDHAEVCLGEILENKEQLIKVRKKLEYYVHKADIINYLDLNELLLLLGEQSKHPFSCLHILNHKTIHMLVENARGEISKGSSLALIRVITSSPIEIKLQVSIKHFLFEAPKEAWQLIVKLGLDGRLLTEDIDALCKIMCQILCSNEENKQTREKAVQVLKIHKNKLSKYATMLLQIEVNQGSNEHLSNFLKCVNEGIQIPPHYFHHLLPLNEQSIVMLEQVTENRVQDLPDFILRNLESFIHEYSNDYLMVFRIVRILLKSQCLSWSDPKITTLLREPYYTNHMLQLILDSLTLAEIPDNLLKEINRLPRTDFFSYFFEEMRKKSIKKDIAITLRNSNVRDEDKKMIIKQIPRMNLACHEILEMLENVIRCERNLRAEAFQSLIQMLPEDYQLNGIWGYLDIKTLRKQDMAVLKSKGCNLIPLLDAIIKNLYNTNTDHAKISSLLEMTSISKLSLEQFWLLLHFAKYSSIKEVRSNIKRFIRGTNYGMKVMLDVGHLEFLENFSLQSDPEEKLNRLQHCVENGFGITEDILWQLIDAVQNEHYMNHVRRNIENILFIISQQQSIPSNVCHLLLRIINAGSASFLSAEFIAFAANIVTCTASLSKKALNSMFNDYENGFMILCGAANYAKERKLPGFVLTRIANYFVNPNENVETRILAAAILAHQENKYGDLPQVITMRVQCEFFNKLLCSEISEEYQILLNFLLDDKSFHEKFFLLHGLSSNPAVNKKILKEFHPNDWRKEFFAYSLFMEMIQTQPELHECFYIKEFRDNFNKLHALAVERSSKNLTTETIYEALLQKQRTFKFSLRDGINVLMMLHSNANALQLLFNSSDSFVQQLKYCWISYSLQVRKIEFTTFQLKELCKYIVYKTIVLDHFFHKLEQNSSMPQLTEFLKMLTESQLPLWRIEEFLMGGSKLFSVRQWQSQLALLLAENVLGQKIKVTEVEIKPKPKQTLKKRVKNYFWPTNTPKESTERDAKCIKEHVKRLLTQLLLSGWSERSLLEMIPDVVTEDQLNALLEALIIIYDYKLTISTTNKQMKTLSYVFKNDCSNWGKKTHEMALYNSFKGTCKKNVHDLIKEICELNKCSELEYLNEHKLQHDLTEIKERCEYRCSLLVPKAHNINLWQEKDLKLWAKSIKETQNKVELLEMIAVVKRAVEISCKFKLRDIQLLTVLTLLQANGGSGCLAQVNTGEGKTIVIAMIAAIHRLNGRTVDIVTSSPELARPQSQEMEPFFSLLNLTVAHNTENNQKMCYSADIVYGAAGNFQGDILRDEFNQVSIRCERHCDIAIVDEVDSMLIDNRNYKVMLSTPMPAMNHLEPVLAAIWVQIDLVASFLEEKNGLLLYKNGNELLRIETTKEEFIAMCTKVHVKKLIRAEEMSPEEERDYPKLHIPKHLFSLVNEIQLDTWIDSAIYAKYGCEKDRHYIIKDNKIVPVDASNTGVIQQNMNWNDGLHQFLQIKHGIRITPESLCTNFISNVAYFRRYKKLCGLTGTLGSTNAINLLRKAYNVSQVYIPPFKKEQHLELMPIIIPNEREYYESIVINSLSKLNNNRAVLIITKYIAEAKKLHKIFIDDFGYDRSKVKTYQTEADTSVIKENLKPREVIIATNIAGRGADIKLEHEIEVHGGLHVCVTFLPSNLRTERQNVGRTSRMGQKGTSQFIILGEHKSITEIRKIRDKKEEIALKNAEQEIERVCVHDEVFASFCELLKHVQNKDDRNDDINMKALEERFALWFRHQQSSFKKGEIERIIQSFKSFSDDIKADADRGMLIANPYFHVQMGNRFLESEQYEKAIQQYTRAIDMDPDFADHAYYNRGYAKVASFGQDVANHEKELYSAVEDFRKAKHIIERYEQESHVIQLTHKAVSEQISVKSRIHAIRKSAIDKAIGTENEIEGQGNKPKEPENKSDHQGIIVQAIQKKWNLKITLEKLQEIFKGSECEVALYEAEIEESENNGCIGSFTLQMVQPSIKWWQCIGLAIVGSVQIIGGIVLHCLKLCSGLATYLVTEGVKDITEAIHSIISRRAPDWGSWGIRKVTRFVTSVVVAGVSTTRNIVSGASECIISCAKELLQKVFGKPIEAQAGQLNAVLGVLTESGLRRSLIQELEIAMFSKIIKPLENLLTDECQEEFVRIIIEGIMGEENVKRYAREIANEIGNKKQYSVLNANLSRDIEDLRSVSDFICYFTRILATELKQIETKSIKQPREEFETKQPNKRLSEKIATQVSGHVASLVEKDIFTAYSINISRIGAEVLTKQEGDDDDEYIGKQGVDDPHIAERWCSKANECLRNSSVLELLICLSDEAQIPIRIFDDKGKWVHTIGKDKVGAVFEIPCNKLTFSKKPENGTTSNSKCIFCEVAEHSGTSAEKLHSMAVQSKSKENLITLYTKELQNILRKGKESKEESFNKSSYLCREQYNQIAYRALTDSKLTLKSGKRGCQKVYVKGKALHWHPDFMSYFKHDKNGAKQITVASAHAVSLNCTDKACVLQICPKESGKSNFGNF